MTGFDLILYLIIGVVAAVFLGAVFNKKFRDKLLLTIGIKANNTLDGMTTAVERAEARVGKLSDEIAVNKRKVSDLRGQLNHEKNNVLARMQSDLDEAKGNYKLAKAALDKNPDDATLQETVGQTIDDAQRAKDAVTAQEAVVAQLQEAVDVAREAIAKATKEIKGLQNKVKTGAAKAKASAALTSAADILEATKDVADRTSGLGKDLDQIDLGLEQAKTRLEDAQGSAADRKLDELKEEQSRSKTLDWLDD